MLEHQFAVDHHCAGRSGQRVDDQQRVDWLRQVNDQRVCIAGTNQRLNVFGAVTVGFPGGSQAEVEFHHPIQRPGHVLGGQSIARVKLDIGAQVEGDLLAVFADFPAFGQLWQVLLRAAAVTLEQRVIQIGIDPRGIQARCVGRVDGEQVDHAHADDQLIGRRLGLYGGHRAKRQQRTQQAQTQERKCFFHILTFFL